MLSHKPASDVKGEVRDAVTKYWNDYAVGLEANQPPGTLLINGKRAPIASKLKLPLE